MALKDTWTPKTDNDYIIVKTINDIAQAVIEAEEKVSTLPVDDEGNPIDVASNEFVKQIARDVDFLASDVIELQTTMARAEKNIEGGFIPMDADVYEIVESSNIKNVNLFVDRTEDINAASSDGVSLQIPEGKWDFFLNNADSSLVPTNIVLQVNDVRISTTSTQLQKQSIRELIGKTEYFSNEELSIIVNIPEMGYACSIDVTTSFYVEGENGLMSAEDKTVLEELKAEVGNISTALDEIHTYAQELIGGEKQ